MKSIYPPIIIFLSSSLFGCAYPRSYYEIPMASQYPMVVPAPPMPQIQGQQYQQQSVVDPYTEAVYQAHENEAALEVAGQQPNQGF